MADKKDLPNCSVAGCKKPVSKAGYSLCYEHWLSAKKSPKAAESSPSLPEKKPEKASSLLSSTGLGERLGLSSQKINQVLAELGWIHRERKGWVPTEQGLKLKAEAKEHHQTGIPFVLWPESLLSSRILTNTVKELSGAKASEQAEQPQAQVPDPASPGFREKFAPTHRATDGHWVRSKAEALIDNWLYMSGLVHAYERQLPVEEELYCDFYIPGGKVYIEYWGLENDPKYAARKATKIDIYKKYNFNLIELTDDHVRNLDDHLPKMLLKYNVIVN
ncbi:hypothetical protein [Azonexus hydrophilus]|uniref:hypothetical protein n=1 Tax=Azonexus hydrophilus TaxID=418702 RepID=UPI0011158991|nr:hypothetical protein [Azonexus hydrophilus]